MSDFTPYELELLAELSATKEKLEAENNLKNLYRGELEQTVDQRNELAKKLEAAARENTELRKQLEQYNDEHR